MMEASPNKRKRMKNGRVIERTKSRGGENSVRAEKPRNDPNE
jgi:hypothetical protein